MTSLSLLISDHFNRWSDSCCEHCHHIGAGFATAAQGVAPPIAAAHGGAARLADRTVQTVWQTRLPLRRRAGAWSQVLPFSELSWRAATRGVRAPSVLPPDHGIPRQLPSRPRDRGADLPDQPRTAPSARGPVSDRHEPGSERLSRRHQCGDGRRAARQYARTLARLRPLNGPGGECP
jgi:hypothetical protein